MFGKVLDACITVYNVNRCQGEQGTMHKTKRNNEQKRQALTLPLQPEGNIIFPSFDKSM